MEDITLSIDLIIKSGAILVATGGVIYMVRDHHQKIKDNSDRIDTMDKHITSIHEQLSSKINDIERHMDSMRASIERMDKIFSTITEIKVKKSK